MPRLSKMRSAWAGDLVTTYDRPCLMADICLLVVSRLVH